MVNEKGRDCSRPFRLGRRECPRDRDHARLERLGDLSCEADRQESIIEPSIDHANVIGEFETALEASSSDAAIKEGSRLGFGPLTLYDERVPFGGDGKLLGREARHG